MKSTANQRRQRSPLTLLHWRLETLAHKKRDIKRTATLTRVLMLFTAMLFLGFATNCNNENRKNLMSGQVTTNEPLSVTLLARGYIYEWQLYVDNYGAAHFSETLPIQSKLDFRIQPSQLAELQTAIVAERFFELDKEYGDMVPDGGTISIKITQGRRSKTVSLLYLENWEQEGNKKLPEAQRAERIVSILMRWKDDATKSQPKPRSVTEKGQSGL